MSTIRTIIQQTIDLDQGVGQPQPLAQRLIYGNDQAHTFQLHCTRAGLDAPLVNTACMGYVRRKDGVTIPLEGVVEGCTASITLSAPCYACAGNVLISLELISGSIRATHGLWVAQVESTTTEEIGGEAGLSVSKALERLDAAARPDWAQNDPDMPDYILGRTHYINFTTVDCTEDLGVYDGWRKVSDMQIDKWMLAMDKTSAIVQSDGEQRTASLLWNLATEDNVFCSVGRVNLILAVIMVVHEEGYALGPGIYVSDSSDPEVLSLTWGEAVPLADMYIPDSIARVGNLPPMDDTLTEAGSTADAKAVGDRMNDLADVIAPTVTDCAITLHDSAARPLRELILHGRTHQEGTPSPDSPLPFCHAGDSGSITLQTLGKNLLNPAELTNAGVTATLDGDTLHIVTTASAAWRGCNTPAIRLSAGKTYILSATVNTIESGIASMGFRRASDNSFIKRKIATGLGMMILTYTATEDVDAYVSILCTDGTAADGDVTYSCIQLEIADAATAYTPYAAGCKLSIPVEGGLPGVPVSSGGSYTDAAGQQWICDEIDLARGVYVQRVAALPSMEMSSWTASALVNPNGQVYMRPISAALPVGGLWTSRSIGVAPAQLSQAEFILQKNTNGLTVLYVVSDAASTTEMAALMEAENSTLLYALAEPVETPLSANVLSRYADMTTLLPDTTILNSAGTGMTLCYAADTKHYIDQRIAAVAAAMLNE